MSLLLPEPGLIFWMCVSFGVVFVILTKYGFPIITNMVEKRKEYIDNSIQVAAQANEKLQAIQEESKTLIAQANKEQGRIIKQANDQRDKIIAQAQQMARQQAAIELEKAREEIRLEKEEAIRDIRRQVALLSVDIAQKVICKELDDQKEQVSMIDRLLDQALMPHNNS